MGKYLSASLGELSSGGSGGGGSGDDIGWLGPSAGSITTTGLLRIGTNTTSGADIRFGNLGSAEFNANNLDQDFTVKSVNKDSAIKVDSSTDQVLILSGGSATSQNESSGEDVSFYVSGSDNLGPKSFFKFLIALIAIRCACCCWFVRCEDMLARV